MGDNLMPALDRAGTNRITQALEVGIVHHPQTTLDVEERTLHLRCLLVCLGLLLKQTQIGHCFPRRPMFQAMGSS